MEPAPDGEAASHTPSPIAFLAATLGLEVLLAANVVISALRRKTPLWACVTSAAADTLLAARSALGFRPDAQRSSKILAEEVYRLRADIGRKLLRFNTGIYLAAIIGWQIRVLTRGRLTEQMSDSMPNSVVWTTLAGLACHTGCCMAPVVVSGDLGYIFFSLFPALYLLPGNSETPEIAARVAGILFALFRLPAVFVASRIYLVLLCNLVYAGLMVVRAVNTAAKIDFTFGGAAMAVTMELVHAMVLLAVAVAFQDYLTHRVEADLESRNAVTQLNAASSLLQLTCDAVVELDGNLSLTKDSRELAAMLFREGSLKGVPFTDLMPPLDSARARVQLTAFRSSRSGNSPDGPESVKMAAHAFHTRLLDSYSTRLRTEVLQVMYPNREGQICHLVGLRDFTDTKPFAAGGDGASADSVPVSISDEDNDDQEGESPQQLPLRRDAKFLDIDVEKLFINASSASLPDVTGHPLSSVFLAPHTQQLMERLHAEGRNCVDRGDPLPSKIFFYEDLPVRFGSTHESICGTMQLIHTQAGVNVLMVFQAPPLQPDSPRSPRSPRSSRSSWSPRGFLDSGKVAGRSLRSSMRSERSSMRSKHSSRHSVHGRPTLPAPSERMSRFSRCSL